MIKLRSVYALGLYAFALAACGSGTDFVLLDEPNRDEANFDGFIINGTEVGPNEFPSVYKRRLPSLCTATQIGPQVILLAAHCFPDDPGADRTITIRRGTTRIEGACDLASDYLNDNSALDLALCKLSRINERPRYEAIDIENQVSEHTAIMFGGFGCYKDENSVTHLESKYLHIGSSTVSERYDFENGRALLYTDQTIQSDGRLCQGDSGGPTFLSTSTYDDPRILVAVNHRAGTITDVSEFEALASDLASGFIRSWIIDQAVDVCGVNYSDRCG